MIEGITPIGIGKLQLTPASAQLDEEKQVSFKEILDSAISEIDQLQKNADEKITGFAAGMITDPHEVMVAIEEASLALQYAMQVRNKVIDAYQEIMRMQV